MKKVIVTIKGFTPYQQGKAILSKRDPGQTADAFEEATWPERMHKDSDGYVLIPFMAIPLCLVDYSKYVGAVVPGKGKATYTKHYSGGIIMGEQPYITVNGKKLHYTDVKAEKVFVPSDGRVGGSTRVMRNFPTIPEGWESTFEMHFIDPVLYEHLDVVETHLNEAGKFIGLGVWRPRSRGNNGRFSVIKFK